MALTLHTSNRLEVLSRLLAQHVSQPLTSTLAPEVIVIQSRGMERWVALELARHNGITANCRFPFPDTIFWDLVAVLYPDSDAQQAYGRDELAFRIMNWLPALLSRPEFAQIKRYLHNDPVQLKCHQLAVNIADLFDQYLLYRPKMILDWEGGAPPSAPEQQWQSILWRKLADDIRKPHRARLLQMIIDDTTVLERAAAALPQRVALFAMTYIAPFHLNIFMALSMVIPVTIYFVNPCREYWADILTEPEAQRIKAAYGSPRQADAMLHLDSGNPLLASMGGVGRDFLKRIHDTDSDLYEHFEDIDPLNMLAQVQSDILNLSNPTRANGHAVGASRHMQPSAADGSIVVNTCHSPMRELEVLHDTLLDLFARSDTLTPGDIVVMAPDIDAYTPYIEAVFGASTDGAGCIPYAVADRTSLHASRFIKGFFSFLDLYHSRFDASTIMALLEVPGVKEKFRLTEAELIMVTRWLAAVNVRWGVDAEHKTRLGLFGSADNTWKAGIQQLLLGYAMATKGQALFAGILPYERIEGSAALTLGKMIEFVDRVTEFATNLTQTRTLSAWQQFFSDTLDALFDFDDDDEPEVQILRRALDECRLLEDRAAFRLPVDCRVVRHWLSHCLHGAYVTGGFLTGGVTFCAMLPMRSIPFEVVCLLGMNDEDFPRASRPVEFDLLRHDPRPGDRSRRSDDKYLFLEAILSARRILYISYIGQDKHDNSIKPPSVVVTDLLDYLVRGYDAEEKSLVTRHRLQAFSPAYFNGSNSRLFSYSADNFKASQALSALKTEIAPFFPAPLPEPADDFRHVDVNQLGRFFANPARFLLQNRLDLYLSERVESVSDVENFSLHGLERYHLDQSLYQLFKVGLNRDRVYQLQRASGRLPVGSVGRYHYDRMSSAASDFVDKIKELQQDSDTEEKSIHLRLKEFVLTGRLTGLTNRGQLKIRFAKCKAADIVNAWICHLAYCLAADSQRPLATSLICSDTAVQFDAARHPRSYLLALLELYWKGLMSPLPFFPETAALFVKQLHVRGQTRSRALAAARRQWEGNLYQRGEKNDEYSSLCFSHEDPLDEVFESVSQTVFAPIAAHSQEMVLAAANWPVPSSD